MKVLETKRSINGVLFNPPPQTENIHLFKLNYNTEVQAMDTHMLLLREDNRAAVRDN